VEEQVKPIPASTPFHMEDQPVTGFVNSQVYGDATRNAAWMRKGPVF